MTNLQDDTEIEILEEEAMDESMPPSEPEPTPEPDISPDQPVDDELEPTSEPAVPPIQHIDTTLSPSANTPVPVADNIADISGVVVVEETIVTAPQQPIAAKPISETIKSPFRPKPRFVSRPVDVEAEAEIDSLFFVDTEPAALVEETPFYLDTAPGPSTSHNKKPMYKSETGPALGHAQDPVSSEEEIVFAPRKYKQPQPTQVDMSQASGSRPTRSRPSPPAAVLAPSHPRAMTRAQKKAAKKDKKKGVGKKLQRARRQAKMADASDIEWGSDGPPRGKVADIEGLEESESENDDDVAILQDYLAGTLLNAKQSSDDEMDADQDLDSDEVDEALQLDMMRRFGEGVSQWNQTGAAVPGSDDGSEEDSVIGEEQEEDEEESDSDDIEIEIDDDSDSDSDSGEDDGEGIILDGDTEADIDRQLALALEKGEEDSDIEELFTGKQGWGDEEDWFLQSMTVREAHLTHQSMELIMQDALDPKAVSYKNRKSNSKLFHAIENGNFDDFDLAVGKFSLVDRDNAETR